MDQSKDVKTDGIVALEVTRVGAYLKSERENRSLSYDQVAQITKLRPYVLKAIENEDWEKLPQSVFLKGFIRSYARALGLKESKILDLFEGLPLDKRGPLKFYAGEKKSRKGFLFILFILLGLITIMVYLLGNWFLNGRVLFREEEVGLRKRTPLKKQVESPSVQKLETDTTVTSKPDTFAPVDQTAKPKDDQGQLERVAPLESPLLSTPSEPVMAPESHKLECFVKARTWVRIRIDNQSPKEYMFEPGGRSVWEAKKGFEVIVGNAAGIEFELDGKRISNLGKSGQVIRLRLPQDYLSEHPEG